MAVIRCFPPNISSRTTSSARIRASPCPISRRCDKSFRHACRERSRAIWNWRRRGISFSDNYMLISQVFGRLTGKRPDWRTVAGILAALSLPAFAVADAGDEFTLQGFGTLGMARTTAHDVEFVRDLSQPRGIRDSWSPQNDSVIGVQGGWRINPQLEAVAQGMSRYGYDGTFDPELSWAYGKYEPTPNLSLRAGRLGTEFFMMADSRWVGYSFRTVRPPGDYFWYLPFYSIYGGDAAVTQAVGEGVLRAKMFYGLSTGQIPLASELWNIDGSPMMGAYLEYQIGGWQVRGSYANI